MTTELPDLSAVHGDGNPLRPGITLPELIKVADAAAAELAPTPLVWAWVIEAAGPVRGRLMFIAAVAYILIRDEAHTDGTTFAEQVCMFGGGVCIMGILIGLIFGAFPVGALIAAGAAFAIAGLAGATARYLGGGEQR